MIGPRRGTGTHRPLLTPFLAVEYPSRRFLSPPLFACAPIRRPHREDGGNEVFRASDKMERQRANVALQGWEVSSILPIRRYRAPVVSSARNSSTTLKY